MKKGAANKAPRSSGGIPQSEEKSEQAKVAREIDTTGVVEAGLDSEEFGLVCKCEGDYIDLLLDTGTVSNLVPEGQREVVNNIKNETTSLIGVGGARVTATETGQAGVFGKSRIVPGAGAICISQRQFGDKFQMINPHKDLVILRGWPRTKYANREYHFTRDGEDQLLHCKLKSTGEMAMVARVAKFYRPEEVPNEEESTTPTALEPIKVMEIRRLHEYYNHPSVNEMKRMANKWFEDLEITPKDIEIWHAKEGKFCSGCVEGKLKEHARKTSTKPLTLCLSTKPPRSLGRMEWPTLCLSRDAME